MKKFFAIMLVLVVMVMTMVSCTDATKNSTENDLSDEAVIIDDVPVGTRYNYGSYYMFVSYNVQSYLIFMDDMDGKIELIDISVSAPGTRAEKFNVTYKLLDTNN